MQTDDSKECAPPHDNYILNDYCIFYDNRKKEKQDKMEVDRDQLVPGNIVGEKMTAVSSNDGNDDDDDDELGSVEEHLFVIFERFCRFGLPAGQLSPTGLPLMDGSRFVKLFRDAGIISGPSQKLTGKKVSSTDCDIVFNSVKRINERKINFDQFASGISILSARIGIDVELLVQLILSCPGPTLVGTTVATAPVLATQFTRSASASNRHSIGSPYTHRQRSDSDIVSILDERESANNTIRSSRYSLKSPSSTGKMPDVFERLCDVSTFTGTQKQKMNDLRIYRP